MADFGLCCKLELLPQRGGRGGLGLSSGATAAGVGSHKAGSFGAGFGILRTLLLTQCPLSSPGARESPGRGLRIPIFSLPQESSVTPGRGAASAQNPPCSKQRRSGFPELLPAGQPRPCEAGARAGPPRSWARPSSQEPWPERPRGVWLKPQPRPLHLPRGCAASVLPADAVVGEAALLTWSALCPHGMF